MDCFQERQTLGFNSYPTRLKREEERIAREMAEKEEEEARAVLEQAARSGKIKLPTADGKLDKEAILSQVKILHCLNDTAALQYHSLDLLGGLSSIQLSFALGIKDRFLFWSSKHFEAYLIVWL